MDIANKTNTVVIKSASAFNLIVGRNGSGKSTFLRLLHSEKRNDANCRCDTINPERGGHLIPDAGVENSMRSSPTWTFDTRNQNQSSNFKQSSVVKLKHVQLSFLIRMERDRGLRNSDATFQSEYIDDINALLHNVKLIVKENDFTFEALDGATVEPSRLSSGESEVIAIASEVLSFLESFDPAKINILFVDEPDVHLHPDLQARLARFIHRRWQRLEESHRSRVFFIIATHSTPLLAAFSQFSDSSIAAKQFGSTIIQMRPCASAISKTLPFIAHPLSSVFNLETPLILEGDDDERVWSQACRSSQGRIRLFPCVAGTVDKQAELEKFLATILPAVYDDPLAISIRDGDGKHESLQHDGCVKRYRLNCYSVENLLLTDDVLAIMNTTWGGFCAGATAWLKANPQHKSAKLLHDLISDQHRLRNTKIKELRHLIVSIAGKSTPWEIIIGKAISAPTSTPKAPHSLADYLGAQLVATLGLDLAPALEVSPTA